MAKRKQLAGLGLKKPPSPPSQNTAQSINKVRISLNKQGKARLAANIARHGGQAKNATIKFTPTPQTQGLPPSKPPITLQGLQRVQLGTTHIAWYMGIARYYTMPTNLIGYIISPHALYTWVFCPKSPTSPPQYLCVSNANNGLTQYAIIKYFAAPKTPKYGKGGLLAAQAAKLAAASPTSKPKKPTVKPIRRAKQKPPTQWGLGQSKPKPKPKKPKPKL
jgi:hypothetical protein